MSKEERDAQDAKWKAEKPKREWLSKIADTDRLMPRWLEDHLDKDHAGVTNSKELQYAYNKKKLIRSQKPKGV